MTDIPSAISLLRRIYARVENVRWRKPVVPRLRVTTAIRHPGTAWFIAPDWNRPSGGLRKQYRVVDVLNDAGIQAAIVHHSRGFRCDWFSHQTRIAVARDLTVSPSDVIVVPETYAASVVKLPRGVRQVIFNQNAYVTLDALAADVSEAASPYLRNPELVAVAAVSDQNAALLSYAFQGIYIHRVRWALDPAIYFPPQVPSGRRIGFMPRRRADSAAQVISLLRLRHALDGWEVVKIDGCNERDTADFLRSCRVFLSFSEREGLGLPPLEAIACGCLVVGYTGYAGREFFRPPFATAIEDGDVGAFAAGAERLLAWIESDPLAAAHASLEGSRQVLDTYSPTVEQHDLVSLFQPMLL